MPGFAMSENIADINKKLVLFLISLKTILIKRFQND